MPADISAPEKETETAAPVAEAVPAPVAAPMSAPAPVAETDKKRHRPRGYKKPPNKRRRKIIARCIVTVIVLALLAGLAYAVNEVFLKEPPVYYETAEVYMGSLENTAYGGGYAKAADSADIAVKQAGTVIESNFMAGDDVMEGDLLFRLDPSPIDDAIEALQDEIKELQTENAEYYAQIEEKRADTSVTAPFAGTLAELGKLNIKEGDILPDNTVLGLYVDDNTLLLTQYYSYAYENDIKVGMPAKVSIPGSMTLIDAWVSRIEKIRKVTPEGAVLFEAEFSLNNPGALTKDMTAIAILSDGDGGEMMPSEPGVLRFYREQPLILGTGGMVTEINMREYYSYKKGHMFCKVEYQPDMGRIETNNEAIALKQERITDEALKYDNLEIYSPISGTVMYNRLSVGDTAELGQAVVSIAQLKNMVIEAQIDERNISGIQPGKMVMLEIYSSDSGYSMFPGEVLTVSLEAKNENGYNYFPAIISADNYSGVILPGMWVSFSVTISAVYDVMIAPINTVKYTPAGETVFVKADEPPPNTVTDLPPEIMAQVPPGFYPVEVITGMGNNQGVEIREGVNPGDKLYTRDIDYNPEEGGGDGYYGGMGGGRVVMDKMG